MLQKQEANKEDLISNGLIRQETNSKEHNKTDLKTMMIYMEIDQ